MQPNGLVTLTTDFGHRDAYTAVLKGVILSINPLARPIDYTHEIEPQQIGQAAYLLHTGYHYFPAGTVHLIVVDPGVGSARRAIALVTPEAAFVAPDNGVLTYIWGDEIERWGRAQLELIDLTVERWWRQAPISATFHGRDIFAPIAAHLTAGVQAHELGSPLDEPLLLPIRVPKQRHDGDWEGRIIHVDRFGNCITNVTRQFIAEQFGEQPFTISILDQRIDQLCRTYSDSEWGTVMALIGSSGHLELAVRNGNAAQTMGVGVGDPLRIGAR